MRYNIGSNGDGGGFMIGGSNIRCHFPEVWLKYMLAFMLRKAEEREKPTQYTPL